MLNKSVSYKSLLRIVGVLFILFGLYLVIRALTSQVVVSGSVQYSGSDLFGIQVKFGLISSLGVSFLPIPSCLYLLSLLLYFPRFLRLLLSSL